MPFFDRVPRSSVGTSLAGAVQSFVGSNDTRQKAKNSRLLDLYRSDYYKNTSRKAGLQTDLLNQRSHALDGLPDALKSLIPTLIPGLQQHALQAAATGAMPPVAAVQTALPRNATLPNINPAISQGAPATPMAAQVAQATQAGMIPAIAQPTAQPVQPVQPVQPSTSIDPNSMASAIATMLQAGQGNAENLAQGTSTMVGTILRSLAESGRLNPDVAARVMAFQKAAPQFSVSGNGSVINRYTGVINAGNPVAQSNLANIAAQEVLRRSHSGLYDAQAGLANVRTANVGKGSKTIPLSSVLSKVFMVPEVDSRGKPVLDFNQAQRLVIDPHALSVFIQFASQNGFNDMNSALAAYLKNQGQLQTPQVQPGQHDYSNLFKSGN